MAMKEAELRSVAVFSNVDQAVKEYQSKPHTPELVTKVYQAIWQERGKRVDAVFEVPQCPYTQKELADLKKRGKRVGYLPVELAIQENRHILSQMFPQMGSPVSLQKSNPVTNDENPSGWFDYETAVDSPYLDTTEEQLVRQVKEDGSRLLSLNQYITASQDNKLLTGQYLDEDATWARLGSRLEGRVACAFFRRVGRLEIRWSLEPGGNSRNLGGRSSGGVKRT